MPTLNEEQHKLVVGIATGKYTPTEAHEELNKIIDSVKAEAHQAGIDEAVEKCIEVVKNSRTLPERYASGVAETTARGQAIMEIKKALQDHK